MRRGANLPALGGFNQAVLLDLVRREPEGLSRVELAERSGLASQTVSNVVRRLLELGLLREDGLRRNGPGKPRTILRLDTASRIAVGVHLDPTVITTALVGLDGHRIAARVERTPSAAEPERVVAGIVAGIEQLVERAGVPVERILGVGIAAPGPIDRDRGVVDDPPLLEGWHGVPLRDAIGEALGLPVALEKDVTAAVVGELWADRSGELDDFGFCYYGTGVGFGFAFDHQAMRGATANLGDIGHLRVRDGGPRCQCGASGCVGVAVAPATLVAEAVASGLLDAPADPEDPALVDAAAAELAALAAAGEPRALALVERLAADLAEGVVQLANLLDLRRIVFGGPFWARFAPLALPRVRELVAASRANVLPHPLVLTSSAHADDAGAIGAACLVLDSVLAPHPSALLIARAG